MSAQPRSRDRVDRRTRGARAERADARARLLAAAGKLIAERGYRGASVDGIAAEAGFSKGAVYWHFRSKEDLLHTLIEERVRERMEGLVERLRAGPAAMDAGHDVGDRYMEMLAGDRELVLLMVEYWSMAVRDPELAGRYAERQAAWRRALADGLAARQTRLGVPDVGLPTIRAATAFLALASGLAMERLADPDAVPSDLFGEIVGLVFQGALASRGAPPAP